MARPVVKVFAKSPRPGHVKTRLAGALGPEGAARLYERWVAWLLERLLTRFDVELHTDIETDAWRSIPVTRFRQVEGGLGHRMLAALPGLILGGDAPTVPLEHLEQLLAAPADVAFGPASDGGYYAIRAMKTHPAMFDGVEWSTSSALNQSVQACLRAGLSVALGPSWRDIDTPADLSELPAHLRPE